MVKKNKPFSEFLPESLQADLVSAELSPVEVLFSNPRKGRWTLKVNQRGERLPAVLKWCHSAADKEHYESFQRELAFYRRFDGNSFLPRPFLFEQNFLLIEYVPGNSLRQYMLACARKGDSTGACEVLETLKLLLGQLEVFYAPRRGHIDLTDTSKELTALWLKLFLSGPMGTKRSRLEKWLARVMAPPMSRIVQRMFRRSLKKAYAGKEVATCGIIHGDLHCNNIIVSDDNKKILLIDFENIEDDRFWMLDLLYLCPMVLKLTKGYELRKNVLDVVTNSSLFSSVEELIFFKQSLRLMHVAIFFNRRFGV